jgi:hypothetical protein
MSMQNLSDMHKHHFLNSSHRKAANHAQHFLLLLIVVKGIKTYLCTEKV